MKRNLFFVALAILGGMLAFTSCGNDDDDVDVRDASVGSYSGTMSLYMLVDGELVDYGEEKSTIESMIVSKNTEDASSIDMNIDGDFLIGEKIAAASNGFSFDVKEQKFEEMTVEGYDAIKLGSSNYNGAYFSDGNKIQVAIQIPIEDVVEDEAELLSLIALYANGIEVESIVMLIEVEK